MHDVIRMIPAKMAIPWLLFTLVAGGAAGACGGKGQEIPAASDGGGGKTSASSSAAGGTAGPYADFPVDPILDTSAGAPPASAGTLFGPEGSGDPGAGPCLVEPTPGTLYPYNFQRPRFRFQPAGKQNLFELRVRAPNELNELVVYTRATEWKIPLAMWR